MLTILKRHLQQHLQHEIKQSQMQIAIRKRFGQNVTGVRAISVDKALEGWDEKLREAGVEDTEFNLKCLVAHVLKRDFSKLKSYKNEKFTEEEFDEFKRLCEARCARMPLQYILGEWDFMDLKLKMAPTVFIPRPETEEFVAKVIAGYRNVTNKVIDMLEIGCGTGAISLAILKALPHVKCTAVERSKAATALAWENAKRLKLNDRFIIHNHITEANNYLPKDLKDHKFDLIISNPPYIKTEELSLLQPEVKLFENMNALDGGLDGLNVAHLIFDLACDHLKSGSKLWMELDSDHPPRVKTIINLQYKQRLRFVAVYKDQYKRDRFVEIKKI